MKIKTKTKHLVCARILYRCEIMNGWIVQKEINMQKEETKPEIQRFLLYSKTVYQQRIDFYKNRQQKLVKLYAYVSAQIFSS